MMNPFQWTDLSVVGTASGFVDIASSAFAAGSARPRIRSLVKSIDAAESGTGYYGLLGKAYVAEVFSLKRVQRRSSLYSSPRAAYSKTRYTFSCSKTSEGMDIDKPCH
jgi:hypothetical protein